MNVDTIIKKKPKKINKKLLMIGILVLAILSLVFFLFVFPKITQKPGIQRTEVASTLENVIKTSQLSTYETVYNGVAISYNEKNKDNIDYYASYKATVKAGLDFDKISISNNDEDKIIIINLPEVSLQDPVVAIEDIDFIFNSRDAKRNQDAILAKAYQLCLDDAKDESKKQKAIYKYAKENAEHLISGLTMPFLNVFEDEYRIEFKWEGE